MAFKLFTLFTLFVSLQIVFSLPIGDEIKEPVSALDKTPVLRQAVSRPSENDYVKLSVVRSRLDVVKRMKRNVIGDDKCPAGQRWFLNECITEEKYDEMMGEDKR